MAGLTRGFLLLAVLWQPALTKLGANDEGNIPLLGLDSEPLACPVCFDALFTNSLNGRTPSQVSSCVCTNNVYHRACLENCPKGRTGDYKCPICRKEAPTLREVREILAANAPVQTATVAVEAAPAEPEPRESNPPREGRAELSRQDATRILQVLDEAIDRGVPALNEGQNQVRVGCVDRYMTVVRRILEEGGTALPTLQRRILERALEVESSRYLALANQLWLALEEILKGLIRHVRDPSRPSKYLLSGNRFQVILDRDMERLRTLVDTWESDIVQAFRVGAPAFKNGRRSIDTCYAAYRGAARTLVRPPWWLGESVLETESVRRVLETAITRADDITPRDITRGLEYADDQAGVLRSAFDQLRAAAVRVLEQPQAQRRRTSFLEKSSNA